MRLSKDRLTFELVRSTLDNLGDEMARSLARAAYSPILKYGNDFATALVTRDSEIITQGRTSPAQLGALMTASTAVRDKFQDQFAAGDIFILNDPYEGGSHLPDIMLIKPIFIGEGDLFCFVCSEAHHADIGGRTPGSNATDSREIYEEGLRIPPSYYAVGGTVNETLMDLLESNSRLPERVKGDLGAQLAALKVGEDGIHELVKRYGCDELRESISAYLDYGERLTRAEIAAWPDGEYDFTDWIDDDGFREEPIVVQVKLTVDGDLLTVDYGGTADQVESAINNPLSDTRGDTLVAVRCAMTSNAPNNSGFVRPITIRVPEGTILNPRPPAAVAARSVTSCRAFDVVVGCLAQIVPERCMAGSHGSNALITFFERDGAGTTSVVTDIHFGSWGARHDRAGVDGICLPSVQVSNTPVETIERETAITVSRYEFVPDTCGAGRHRGGLAVVREYRVESDQAVIQVRGDRLRVPPYGLFGGGPGALASHRLNPGAEEERMPSKHTVLMAGGDTYAVTLAGGGGWGDPLESDPSQIHDDVRNEKVTPTFARDVFGVVTHPESGVNYDETANLRALLRASASSERTENPQLPHLRRKEGDCPK